MSTREFTEAELTQPFADRRYVDIPSMEAMQIFQEGWNAEDELQRIAGRHGVTPDEIRGQKRDKHISAARHAFWGSLHAKGWSCASIARFTGHHYRSVCDCLLPER